MSYSYGEDEPVVAAAASNCTFTANMTLDCSFEALYDEYGLAIDAGMLCLFGLLAFTALFNLVAYSSQSPPSCSTPSPTVPQIHLGLTARRSSSLIAPAG